MQSPDLETLQAEWRRRHTLERARRFVRGELTDDDLQLLDAILALMPAPAPPKTRSAR